jgi:elongation of very long chain fatty acids protein 6
MNWMRENPFVPLGACALYGLCIGLGQWYFQFGGKDGKGHPQWQFRCSLAAWNLFLATFSVIGMLRTGPQLVHNLVTYSIQDNLCLDPLSTYGSGSTGLWVQLFILSKFPELFDTFFIVVHKKPLIFLHWYHHVTVLLYCWHSYVTTSPPGIFFVVMNYSVHAVMYFYYFLMAVRMKPKWFPAAIVTVFQISQMVVGVIVTLVAFYFYTKHLRDGSSCKMEAENNTAAFAMYGSYLFLFLQFFIGRYLQNDSPDNVKLVTKQREGLPSHQRF